MTCRNTSWFTLVRVAAYAACIVACAGANAALAQKVEEPDPTRLDAERVPPEAVQIKRSMFATGLGLEAQVGAMGFASGLSRLLNPGLYANIGIVDEIFPWLALKFGTELSMHSTDAPPPPDQASLEFLGAFGELRLQAPIFTRFSIWAGGQLGAYKVLGDVLQAYGVGGARNIGAFFGAQLGLDWHMLNRHQSVGITAGARMYPAFDVPTASATTAANATFYIRHIF